MEKRTERNKQLYKEVDKKIADIAKKNSNREFENTNNKQTPRFTEKHEFKQRKQFCNLYGNTKSQH